MESREDKGDHATKTPISNETSRAYATRISSFAECSQKTWIICICFRSCSQPIWRRLRSVLFLAWKTASKELTCSGLGRQSWARRTIIQKCNSHVGAPQEPLDRRRRARVMRSLCSFGRTQDTDYVIARLLRLRTLRTLCLRDVRSLEKYSDQDFAPFCLAATRAVWGKQECERCCISRSQTGSRTVTPSRARLQRS